MPASPGALDPELPSIDRKDIRKKVIALALPAIGHSLLHVAVFFIDRMLLGQYSSDAIAAMQIAGPLNWTLYSLLTCYMVGSVATVARATGARDKEEVQLYTAVSIRLSLIIGILAMGLVFLLPLFLSFYESENLAQSALDGSYDYLSVVLLAYPLFSLGVTASSIMAATGDTRTPFFVGIITNSVNIVLNYGLIFGRFGFPEWGIYGAAVATACSWACEAVILGKKAILGRLSMLWFFSRVRRKAAVSRIFKISIPTFGERLVFHIGFLIFAYLITTISTEAMAANQAVISIESLSFTTSTACGGAAAAIVGQQLGAKNPEAAEIGAIEAMKLALVLLSGAALLYLFAAAPIVSLFTDDPEILRLGVTVLMICALEQPGLAIADVISQSLRGAGDTRSPLLVTLCSTWFIRVSLTWLVVSVFEWGLIGVWCVTAVDWTLRAGMLFWIFKRGRWKTLKI
ncbi:MAG: MATE family efflux transporter [Planctomycetota bacterium]|nr:MATE family efflux transporter [Planctomycetota bacterium]